MLAAPGTLSLRAKRSNPCPKKRLLRRLRLLAMTFASRFSEIHRRQGSLSAVIQVQLLQCQRIALLLESGLDYFTYDNCVITVFMEADDFTLHPRRGVAENRTTSVGTSLVGKAAQFSAF